MRIFIGHDSRFPQATRVCKQSILRFWPEADITFLDKAQLTKAGIYGRKDVEGESTEFSFTRFYVPLLCNYKGIALFCDNDFLFMSDPRQIRRYLKDKAMAVVKHKDYEIKDSKMNGVVNKSYPKKNWSSLILFDNGQFKTKLSKEYLDNATPAQLHEFHFINDKNIAPIHKRFNCLVGHYDPKGACALHYTNGGPWFDELKDGELSEEWWKVYETL